MADKQNLGIELVAGVTKIRVYMWIEGHDYDCQDFASGTDLAFNLGFTIDGTASTIAPDKTVLTAVALEATTLRDFDNTTTPTYDPTTFATFQGAVGGLLALPEVTLGEINAKILALRLAIDAVELLP